MKINSELWDSFYFGGQFYRVAFSFCVTLSLSLLLGADICLTHFIYFDARQHCTTLCRKKTEDNKELRLSTKSKKKVAAYVFVRVAHMTATTTTHQQGHKSYEQIILNYFLERTTQHMILHDKLNIGKLGTEVHSCIKSGSVFLSHETEASKRACCHASVCVYC